jgi:anti-sigma B factor antagonist
VAHNEQYGRHRGDGRPGLFRHPLVDQSGSEPGALHAGVTSSYDPLPEYRSDFPGAGLMTDIRTAVLQPTGRLNMVAAPAFKNLVEETVSSGQTRIIVDLGEVTFIDSSGLGALIAGLKATRQAGGDLRIAAVPEQVMTVLRLTNLDRVLRAHTTVLDASHDW